jgi:uncharacterized protein YecE (DUF72 family)
VRLICGTSGYSYKEWKGSFYPEKLPAAKMLEFYATKFNGVEINNTFYRMPDEKTLVRWKDETPEGFVFVLKAPQRITHQKKLAGVEDDVRHLLEVGAALGEKFGPLLVQLPPYLRKDLPLLSSFLALFPRGVRVAMEFRHASWDDAEVRGVLQERGAALCAGEMDDTPADATLVHATTPWGYARLRKVEYSDDALRAWSTRIDGQGWEDAYVFFKHEDEAKGPAFANRFLELRGN